MKQTFVDLSYIHEVETVGCDNPSCSCEGDTCENFLTSLFKTDGDVPPHTCSKKCESCLCSVVKKLEESTNFRFTLIDFMNDKEVHAINPEIAISRPKEDEEGETVFYSSNMTFRDLVRSFKIKEIRSIKNYFEFHAHSGVTCGGCMWRIDNELNEAYKSKDRDFFVRGEISTKRFDVWSSEKISKKEVKKLLPKKFTISFYQYYEIQGIHCGGCERKITNTLDLNQYRSFEFIDRKYLRIESDKPLKSKKIKIPLEEINKPAKVVSRPMFMKKIVIEEEEEEEEEEEVKPLEKKRIEEENEDEDEENMIEIIIEEEDSKKIRKKKKEEEEEIEISEETTETATTARLLLQVGGMTCGNCATKVHQNLNSNNGVLKADVVMMSRKAIVIYDPKAIDESTIIKRLTKIGFPTTKLMEVSTDGEIILCLNKTSSSKLQTTIDFFDSTKGVQILEKRVRKKRKFGFPIRKREINVQFKIKFEGKWSPRRIIKHVKEEYNVTLELEKGNLKALKETLMKKKELRVFFCQFLFSFFFTLPATIFALFFGNIHAIGGHPKTEYEGTGIYTSIWRAINVKTVVLFILCTPVQIISGFLFYKKAIKLLIFDRSLDKNTLITISCWVAYTVSIVSVVYGMFDEEYMGKNYMEGSAMLICFLLLGRWLESIATRKTSTSLIKLMKLQPDKALLCVSPEDPDDILEALGVNVVPGSTCGNSAPPPEEKEKVGVKTEEVDVNLLWPGDIVEVKIGCKIPTDGIVVHGSSEINQAMVTGESVYVNVEAGSEVIGGTVNISHPIFIKITKSTQNNMLSKIVKMIEEAQANKPKIQDVLDKISLYFVPIVCMIAIFVLILWLILTLSEAVPRDWLGRNNPVIFSILQATSTLVVACPCTLGLAVPLVIMVANGIGAKYGVIVKGGHVFEKLVKSDIICFDKTGTLTQGKLSIAKLFLFDKSVNQKSLMAAIAGCELSIPSHPIAQTIIDYVKEKFPDLKDQLESSKPEKFEHVNGQGLKCEIKPISEDEESKKKESDCDRLLIGNLRLLENNGVEIGGAKRDQIDKLCAGKTRVFVSLNEKIVAIFTLVDQLRPEIKEVVDHLRETYHLKVMMLTGDHDGVAMKIGKDELGMAREDILSELTPIGKAEVIKKLQRKGHTVVFVGDGVNDSVGLSQSDVGISLKSGTEIAIECSNIVLMKKTMLSLLLTFHLSKRCYRRIKLNVFWAFLYNAITIPIAGGILFPIPGFRMIVPPWICAISMTLSCLSVTFNTILFRCVYRPPRWLKKAIRASEEEDDDFQDGEKEMSGKTRKKKGEEERYSSALSSSSTSDSSSSSSSSEEEEEKEDKELKPIGMPEKLILEEKGMIPSVQSSVDVFHHDQNVSPFSSSEEEEDEDEKESDDSERLIN